MKTEDLLLDRALDELSPGVSELLDEFLICDPAATEIHPSSATRCGRRDQR